MSERLDKAQRQADRSAASYVKEDFLAAHFQLLIAVDALISEIRELRIELGK
jgi:hypothetical protein